MTLKLPSIKDVENKVVLMRVDYNVPLKTNLITRKITIANDERIKASLKTINFLLKHHATVILISHLGRPKSKQDTYLSLKPIAVHIKKKFKLNVQFIPTCSSIAIKKGLDDIKDSKTKILLLENLRFCPEEKQNHDIFAKELTKYADIYINEAFSTSHRKHTSIYQVTKHLPSFAGFNLNYEVQKFSQLMTQPTKPLVIILGGAKISDKVGAIQHLAKIADIVLVGGAVANSFLQAEGINIYQSYIEDASSSLKKQHIDYTQIARQLIKQHKTEKMLLNNYIPLPKILYPIDVIASNSIQEKKKKNTIYLDLTKKTNFRKNKHLLYLDIGPKTIKLYQEIIKQAHTIFWNGPMGTWENKLFSQGTKQIAKQVAKNKYTTIIGGGDTISAVNHFKLKNKYSYVSTAGGATLELLSGHKLIGLKNITK